MTVPCIMITPRRKLAGQLAVLKNALHFFGEFLLEGTAGSSVFRTFESLKNSELEKVDELSGIDNVKFLKLPVDTNLVSEKHSDVCTLERQLKGIKRHRRWEVSKVMYVTSLPINFVMFCYAVFVI